MTPLAARCFGDEDLVARLRAGDEAAFEEAVRRHAPRLIALALRLLRDRDEAHEAVQEGFVSAFRSLEDFEGRALLGTWLYQIVLRASLMRLRRRRRRREQSIEGMTPAVLEEGRAGRPAGAWHVTALESMERDERSAHVRRCIDGLPEAQRTVLMLRDIEEMDTREVARLLGCSANAVKVRLHRARHALRGLLEPWLAAPERDRDRRVGRPARVA